MLLYLLFIANVTLVTHYTTIKEAMICKKLGLFKVFSQVQLKTAMVLLL